MIVRVGYDECAHKVVDIISGGFRRCRGCTAIEGTDGVWRKWVETPK